MAPTKTRLYLTATKAARFTYGVGRLDSIEFDLQEPIIGENLYISLESASIPMTQKNCNTFTNCNLWVLSSAIGLIRLVTPTAENTPDSLQSVLQSLMTSYFGTDLSLVWYTAKGKYEIVNDSVSTTYTILVTTETDGNRSLARTLGFDTDIVIDPGSSVYLPLLADFLQPRWVRIGLPAITTGTDDCDQGKNLSGGILGCVPVSVPYGSVQTFIASENAMVPLSTQSLSNITITLQDHAGKPYNPGLDWSIVALVTSR